MTPTSANPSPHSSGNLRFAPAGAAGAATVCVVAELGVNHDGDVDRAHRLVDAAAEAGADAVKLQLFDPEQLLSKQAILAQYQAGESDPPAMLRRLALSPEQVATVLAAARLRGLATVITPFSLTDLPSIRALGVDAVKIASPDAVNRPLLRQAAMIGKPMLVSTGTCELAELEFAASVVRRTHGCLMQCVSSYPTPMDAAALGGIAALAQRFGLPVGYSDHTDQVVTGALAVTAGACVLEKHLTLDRAAPGPDHAASLGPEQFAEYVRLVRQAAPALGAIRKSVLPIEADVRTVSRQSVCAVRDLPAGHVITREDITVKRPGTGIPAAEFENVIGKTVARPVQANSLLTGEDIG